MNNYRIVGMSKPNNVKLSSLIHNKIIEMPIGVTRKLYKEGAISILNPDSLYLTI